MATCQPQKSGRQNKKKKVSGQLRSRETWKAKEKGPANNGSTFGGQCAPSSGCFIADRLFSAKKVRFTLPVVAKTRLFYFFSNKSAVSSGCAEKSAHLHKIWMLKSWNVFFFFRKKMKRVGRAAGDQSPTTSGWAGRKSNSVTWGGFFEWKVSILAPAVPLGTAI